MEGLEKILGRIKDESDAKINDLLAKANADASVILREAREKADLQCAEIEKRTDAEIINIKERTVASKELKSKQVKLVARREAIDDTLLYVKEKIGALSIKEYGDLLSKVFDKFVTKEKVKEQNVKLCFGEKDLKNLSKDVIDGLLKNAKDKGINMTLSDKAANIKNGFLLDYGDILENCSFDAMIDQNKEVFEDKINKVLF